MTGFPHAFIYGPRCIRARKNKKKKQNEQNSRVLQNWPKRQKRENNIKCPKKRGMEEKKVQQEANHHDVISQNAKQEKNRQKEQTTAQNGEL